MYTIKSRIPLEKHIDFAMIVGLLYALKLSDVWQSLGDVLATFQVAISISASFVFVYNSGKSIPGYSLSKPPFIIFILFYATILSIQFVGHGADHFAELIAYTINAFFYMVIIPSVYVADSAVLKLLCRWLARFSIVLCFFSIISLFSDSFLGIPFYVKDNYAQFSGFPAVAGIFEHPSHIAIFFSYGMIASAYMRGREKTHSKLWTLAMGSCVLGILLSQGRVGLISTAAFALPYLLLTLRRLKGPAANTLLAMMILLGTVIGIALLSEGTYILDFLRVSQGSSGRLGAWEFAMNYFVQKPFLGYGAHAQSEITTANEAILRGLYGSQIHDAGFHNSFIDTMIQYGGFAVTELILIILIGAWNAVRDKHEDRWTIFSLVLVSFLSMSFVGMSFGGARIQSIVHSFTVGMAIAVRSGCRSSLAPSSAPTPI